MLDRLAEMRSVWNAADVEREVRSMLGVRDGYDVAVGIATQTIPEASLRLVERRAQIANARMNDMHDVWAHPQLRARGRWTEVGTPAGPIPALLPPGAIEWFSPRMDAVPALGQHTESILVELGRSSAEISALRGAQAI